MKTIYAIRDRVANDLAGSFPLVVFRTDAQAIRYFADSMQIERSALAAHPNDYELISCGTIEDDGHIGVPHGTMVIATGEAIMTMIKESQQHGVQLVKEA